MINVRDRCCVITHNLDMLKNLIFNVNFNVINFSFSSNTLLCVISSLRQNPPLGLTLTVTPHPVKLGPVYMARSGSVLVRYLQACSRLFAHY